jgi:hypothetical protein
METLEQLSASEYFSSKFKISTLTYPDDLGSGNYGGHFINFYIYTPPSSTWKSSSTVSGLSKEETLGSASETYTEKRIKEALRLNSTTQDQGVIKEGIKGALEFLGKGVKSNISNVISLYMPDTISLNQSALYKNQSLREALGDKLGISAAIAGSLSASEVAAESGANISTAMQSGKPVLTESGSKNFANLVGGDPGQFSSIALDKMGYAINPQMQVIFSEMNFRTYAFDFFLTARSFNEAKSIREILKTFRMHQAPEVDLNTFGRYYILPSVFDIEYMFNGKQNDNLHKIATCVLKTVNVDYAPNGFVTYVDGMPAQVRLTLQFQEKEVMTKQRIQEGY